MSDACIVRAITEDDLPMVLAWRNHLDVRGYMLTQNEISLEEHLNWFARVKDDKTRQQLIVLEGSDPLGFVQFNPVCQGGIADWGFYARPGAPKGSGSKLGQAALAHAFKALGLHKVCGQAIESNVASIAFHQKLGFAEEGRLREQKRISDQYHTLFCFGLLAKDWHESQLKQEQPNATN
ncbi:UDP-4-amino-4,6-dideoxy-N-acetyl-beta-L-altrosamine N-acetyltransferase [Limnohabitans sp. 15K]|uniref:UDP-4-amino-4, 6-dideoxy-N-acetyl-beta-L-altrosamine N-acetyltransferase n=1 Tax=Limnohabitans sp. 15K TaxID=1100706 RepID=UPI000CAE5DFA|nr:UDP-4-amino-4,6-dideoxy-N-acetyl-beta-L-altrosamine N-acetyltransferase [Limnohabitans sp. 15K]PIT82070.1 UDP-4-amino-4,6-dideoxy-N-acetyl-beta-L-altrosamine N-acetyltransferase [Limnohabitans sp. 15K]